MRGWSIRQAGDKTQMICRVGFFPTRWAAVIEKRQRSCVVPKGMPDSLKSVAAVPTPLQDVSALNTAALRLRRLIERNSRSGYGLPTRCKIYNKIWRIELEEGQRSNRCAGARTSEAIEINRRA